MLIPVFFPYFSLGLPPARLGYRQAQGRGRVLWARSALGPAQGPGTGRSSKNPAAPSATARYVPFLDVTFFNYVAP